MSTQGGPSVYDTTILGNPVVVIDLNARWADCHVCGDPTPCQWGLPVWNGFIVANDWPGTWGGVPACYSCWEKHERGELVEVSTSEYRAGD